MSPTSLFIPESETEIESSHIHDSDAAILGIELDINSGQLPPPIISPEHGASVDADHLMGDIEYEQASTRSEQQSHVQLQYHPVDPAPSLHSTSDLNVSGCDDRMMTEVHQEQPIDEPSRLPDHQECSDQGEVGRMDNIGYRQEHSALIGQQREARGISPAQQHPLFQLPTWLDEDGGFDMTLYEQALDDVTNGQAFSASQQGRVTDPSPVEAMNLIEEEQGMSTSLQHLIRTAHESPQSPGEQASPTAREDQYGSHYFDTAFDERFFEPSRSPTRSPMPVETWLEPEPAEKACQVFAKDAHCNSRLELAFGSGFCLPHESVKVTDRSEVRELLRPLLVEDIRLTPRLVHGLLFTLIPGSVHILEARPSCCDNGLLLDADPHENFAVIILRERELPLLLVLGDATTNTLYILESQSADLQFLDSFRASFRGWETEWIDVSVCKPPTNLLRLIASAACC
tara:strand:+ start:373 stop:1746 length:1374 start_codon:yes stop_codon:yes gene_type:complete